MSSVQNLNKKIQRHKGFRRRHFKTMLRLESDGKSDTPQYVRAEKGADIQTAIIDNLKRIKQERMGKRRVDRLGLNPS